MFAVPVGYRGLRGDVQAVSAIGPLDMDDVPAGTCLGRLGDHLAVGPGKFDLAILLHRHPETDFVNQPVVPAAQQHEVVHASLAAVGPVADVVGVDETGAGTAGEAAALVAVVQGAADGGRDGAGFASDIQRFAPGGLVPMDDGGIAGQAPGRFRGNVAATVEFGLGARAVSLEGFHIGVEVHQVAVAA